MTLREYFVIGLKATEKAYEQAGKKFSRTNYQLFEDDSVAHYAELWSIDQFTKLMLGKEWKECTYNEIYKKFKETVDFVEQEALSYENLYQSELDKEVPDNNDRFEHFKGGTRKRVLSYNENYEQSREEDFD